MIEVTPKIKFKSIHLTRSAKCKDIVAVTTDGKTVNLGGPARAFTQNMFLRNVKNATEIKVCKRSVRAWDTLCVQMMNEMQEGGCIA